MAEVVPDDILENILLRLMDLKHIMQCKSVCKSWYCFISSSGFVKSHLKHNNNTTTRRTRIVIQDDYWENNVVGSSNGLVCMYTSYYRKLCVLNPCTRELRTLKDQNNDILQFHGFGYDPSSDDYKVIQGRFKYEEDYTRFYRSSLKSNSWTVVGDVKYYYGNGAGILCNGALHWLLDLTHNPVILSFHLSTQEFEDIPPPADDRCEFNIQTRLGLIEECLCIFDKHEPVWVLKNYNDKQSWKLMPPFLQWDEDIIQDVKLLKPDSSNGSETFFLHNLCLSKAPRYISAPVFVQSLVSPHFNKRQINEEEECNGGC